MGQLDPLDGPTSRNSTDDVGNVCLEYLNPQFVVRAMGVMFHFLMYKLQDPVVVGKDVARQ